MRCSEVLYLTDEALSKLRDIIGFESCFYPVDIIIYCQFVSSMAENDFKETDESAIVSYHACPRDRNLSSHSGKHDIKTPSQLNSDRSRYFPLPNGTLFDRMN